MTISKIFLNDNAKFQNNPIVFKQNINGSEMPLYGDLQRQPQEDNFKGKELDKKKIITYASVGVILTTLLGVAVDYKFAKGKHVKNLWRKITGNVQDIKSKSNETPNFSGKADVNTPNIPDKPDVVQPKPNEDIKHPKTTDLDPEKQSQLKKQVEEFFRQEEKNLEEIKQAKKLSDSRNEIWVSEQHKIKEQEYSDFWNRALEEEEKYNRISFNVEIEKPKFGNHEDLDWYLGRFKQSKYTRDILDDCKDLTFDSPNLRLIKSVYNEDNIYDLGLRYAIVANNTAKKKGSATLIREIPEIFKGIDEKELVRKLDLLPSFLEEKITNTFTINGKRFQAELIGSGCIKDVYKITDSANNQVCFIYGRNPYLMHGGQGFYNEFAILNEANKSGVIDVPKFYMGNPVGCIAQNPKFIGTTTKGAWEIVELVKPNTKVPSSGLKLREWLKNLGLFHGDVNSGTYVGDKIVDLGGIYDTSRTVNLIEDNANEIAWLFRAYQDGKTSEDIVKYMDKYNQW